MGEDLALVRDVNASVAFERAGLSWKSTNSFYMTKTERVLYSTGARWLCIRGGAISYHTLVGRLRRGGRLYKV